MHPGQSDRNCHEKLIPYWLIISFVSLTKYIKWILEIYLHEMLWRIDWKKEGNNFDQTRGD
jgi:hypothetical protein